MVALSASWTPCHDDALNDRSSMPPVSVTMHALKAAVDAVMLGEDDDVGVLDDLPHAAASSATAAIAAAAGMVPLTVTSSLTTQSVVARTDHRLRRPPKPAGDGNPEPPAPGCPQVRPGATVRGSRTAQSGRRRCQIETLPNLARQARRALARARPRSRAGYAPRPEASVAIAWYRRRAAAADAAGRGPCPASPVPGRGPREA